MSFGFVGIDTAFGDPADQAAAVWPITTVPAHGRCWQLVDFPGPSGRESTGIVDLLALRKDHSTPICIGLKRGDRFQIILIQIEGGTAGWPSRSDIGCLRAVAKHHRAESIVLADWGEGVDRRLEATLQSPPTSQRIGISATRTGGH